MKNNYPIKYALIPMIEQVGWTNGFHNLERKYEPVCYIVVKCYLVKQTIEYNIKGNVNKNYFVVCPYYLDEFGKLQKQEPTFNLINGECTNAIVTDRIFSMYSNAKKARIIKNENLFNKKIEYLSFDDLQEKYDDLLKKHNDKVFYYCELEKEIETKTTNLEIGKQSKEQSLIMFDNGKYKKIDRSLYEIIDLFDNEDYEVYSLTTSEYRILEGEIPISSTLFKSKKDYELLLRNDGKTNIASILPNSDTEQCLYKGKIYNCQSLGIVTGNGLNPKIKFYTTENYEDLINSYSFDNEKSPVKKLTKKDNK